MLYSRHGGEIEGMVKADEGVESRFVEGEKGFEA
jgi:hypothetical protein